MILEMEKVVEDYRLVLTADASPIRDEANLPHPRQTIDRAIMLWAKLEIGEFLGELEDVYVALARFQPAGASLEAVEAEAAIRREAMAPMDTKATEGSAHTMMIRLSEAIRTRKLKIAEVHGENGNKTAEAFLHGAALRQMKPNELADRDIRISRDKLKAYAERIGEKPKFLYPEVRK